MELMMNQDNEKLPLEYPVWNILRMYAYRLLIFFIFVVANFVSFGILFLISKLPLALFSAFNVFLILFIFFLLHRTVVHKIKEPFIKAPIIYKRRIDLEEMPFLVLGETWLGKTAVTQAWLLRYKLSARRKTYIRSLLILLLIVIFITAIVQIFFFYFRRN